MNTNSVDAFGPMNPNCGSQNGASRKLSLSSSAPKYKGILAPAAF